MYLTPQEKATLAEYLEPPEQEVESVGDITDSTAGIVIGTPTVHSNGTDSILSGTCSVHGTVDVSFVRKDDSSVVRTGDGSVVRTGDGSLVRTDDRTVVRTDRSLIFQKHSVCIYSPSFGLMY